jgi:Phenylalanyl-tRNA synthetase beta subunit
MKSVLANIGCTIKPEKNDQFIIKKSKIRGVESFGMLCSEEELNLSDDSEGIIELSKDCKVGEKFSTYVSDENIEIEIAITPNRVDCAGVYGIARDLSAAGFGILKLRKANKVAVEKKSSIKLKNTLQDSVCPQFLLREITHLKNRKSSSAIIKRFKGSGLKVISSLVDITNYITIDFCRPLHVFDLDKIQGNITIRLSEKGEEFLGLDEKNYSLDENMIVICDEKNIISLAGILGGKNTCCDDNTKNILVESAYFDPEIIASAGRKLNITSDARYRLKEE